MITYIFKCHIILYNLTKNRINNLPRKKVIQKFDIVIF